MITKTIPTILVIQYKVARFWINKRYITSGKSYIIHICCKMLFLSPGFCHIGIAIKGQEELVVPI